MGVLERRQREKTTLRREILAAARELIAKEGYESVSMRKIAERIEYSPTTIYLYFRDKEELVREVCEETGLLVRIISTLGAINYTFVQRGMRIHKTVHYFLMEPIGGSFDDHDQEFEAVRWVSFEDAHALLSFETELSLVTMAAGRLPELRSAKP
jgi:AcrR family transcriptional regulator